MFNFSTSGSSGSSDSSQESVAEELLHALMSESSQGQSDLATRLLASATGAGGDANTMFQRLGELASRQLQGGTDNPFHAGATPSSTSSTSVAPPAAAATLAAQPFSGARPGLPKTTPAGNATSSSPGMENIFGFGNNYNNAVGERYNTAGSLAATYQEYVPASASRPQAIPKLSSSNTSAASSGMQDYVKSLEKIRSLQQSSGGNNNSNNNNNHHPAMLSPRASEALQRLRQARAARESLVSPPVLEEIDDSDLGEHGEIMSELGFSNLMPSAWELHARRAILMAVATNGASIGSLQTMDNHARTVKEHEHFLGHKGSAVQKTLRKNLDELCRAQAERMPRRQRLQTERPMRSSATTFATSTISTSTSTTASLINKDPNLSGWAAQALLPLLTSSDVKDSDWAQSVQCLLNIVHESNALSLTHEAPDYVQNVVETMLHSNNVKCTTATTTTTTTTTAPVPRRDQLAMSTAIAITVRHGTLCSIVSLCRKLFHLDHGYTAMNVSDDSSDSSNPHAPPSTPLTEAATASLQQLTTSLSSDPVLLELIRHRTSTTMPRVIFAQDTDTDPNHTSNLRSGPLSSFEVKLSSPRAKRSAADRCTAARMHGFLYAYSRALGCVKVGTGYEGTLKGHVYARNDSFPLVVADAPEERKEKKERNETNPPTHTQTNTTSSSPATYANGDLFALGDGSLWFHGDNTENLHTNGCVARAVHPDTMAILPRSLLLQTPNGGIGGTRAHVLRHTKEGNAIDATARPAKGDDLLPFEHYVRVFSCRNILFGVRPRVQPVGVPASSANPEKWSDVRTGAYFEIDVYSLVHHSNEPNAVMEYVRSFVLQGSPVMDDERQWLKTYGGSVEAMSKVTFFATAVREEYGGASGSTTTSVDNMILGVVLPVKTTTSTSASAKTATGGSGGGNTCCCFFDTTNGRRVSAATATSEHPYGSVGAVDQDEAIVAARMPEKNEPGTNDDANAGNLDDNDQVDLDHWDCEECGNEN